MLKDLSKNLGSTIRKILARSSVDPEDVDIILSMMEATKADLEKIASEDGENMPKKEWEELNKQELVKYLYLKSN